MAKDESLSAKVEDIITNKGVNDEPTTPETDNQVETNTDMEASKPSVDISNETKTEDNREKVVETNATESKPTTDTKQDNPGGDEPSGAFDISAINREVGGNYKDLSELKAEIESLRGSVEEREKLISEYKENVNPLSYFANENEYKIQKVIKENPHVNRVAVNNIINGDVDNMSALEVLKLKTMLSLPPDKSDSKIIEEAIKDQYGLSVSFDDMDEDEKSVALRKKEINEINLERDAYNARQELKDIANVEMPANKSVEDLKKEKQDQLNAQIKELQGQWEVKAPQLKSMLDKVEIESPDGRESSPLFTFNIDDASREKLVGEAVNLAIQNGYEPTAETISDFADGLKKDFIVDNITKIMQTYGEDLATKLKDDHYKQTHNPKPANENESPDTQALTGNAKVQAEIASQLGVQI
jgi:hypothetical protein